MLTFTQQKDLYGELTTGTANLQNVEFGGRMINADIRRLTAKLGNNIFHDTATATAVVNQQEYELPNKLKRLRAVTFTIGSNTQYIKKVPDRRYWDTLNTATSTAYTADFPEWFYIFGGRKVRYWPTPASASATITYDFDKRFVPPSVSDYRTGTITTATNGSTTIAGSSLTWSSAMVGRFFMIEKSDTYENDGDGDFYEVNIVNSSTQLNLKKKYEGHSIVSGAAAYRIGEISPLPDGFHELPVYRSAEFYFSKTDKNRSAYFKNLSDGMEGELSAANDPYESVVEEDTNELPENPNFYIRA